MTRPGYLTSAVCHQCAVNLQKRLLVTPASKDKSSDAHRDTEQDDGIDQDTGKHEKSEVVDLRDLDRQQRQQIVDNALATNEQSNEVLLERYAERAERWGINPQASSQVKAVLYNFTACKNT